MGAYGKFFTDGLPPEHKALPKNEKPNSGLEPGLRSFCIVMRVIDFQLFIFGV
jgi:hypothetical protein